MFLPPQFRHRVIYGVESWNGVVEWSGVRILEWSGVYFITMLFAYWNLELSWEISIKCSLHKHNDNSILQYIDNIKTTVHLRDNT